MSNEYESQSELIAKIETAAGMPIYRAKKIDSDEWVEGSLAPTELDGIYIMENLSFIPVLTLPTTYFIRVDPKTLAIHFPQMLDKNKKRIFASLSEDGVGGDILQNFRTSEEVTIFIYREGFFRAHVFYNKKIHKQYYENKDIGLWLEVIGIHKG